MPIMVCVCYGMQYGWMPLPHVYILETTYMAQSNKSYSLKQERQVAIYKSVYVNSGLRQSVPLQFPSLQLTFRNMIFPGTYFIYLVLDSIPGKLIFQWAYTSYRVQQQAVGSSLLTLFQHGGKDHFYFLHIFTYCMHQLPQNLTQKFQNIHQFQFNTLHTPFLLS